VDSSLLLLTRHAEPLGSPAERERTFALVDAAFAQRRKMLRAALAGMYGSSLRATTALEAAGIDPTRRGETLTVQEFLDLTRSLGPRG
jgi:16S rRNA (adenine1518-N6/adenine1519-N6)-dimethyltransferase